MNVSRKEESREVQDIQGPRSRVQKIQVQGPGKSRSPEGENSEGR